MSKKPIISIVMPIFNAEKYLIYALKSILLQTIENWELILIDDGSTDNSFEILNNINDKRFIKLKNDRNYGNSYSCNRGIEMAKGKYIARMDADDICFPNRLEMQLKFMENNPDVDAISCGSIKTNNKLDIIYGIDTPPTDHKEITKLYWFNKQILFGTNIWITDGALFAKSEWFKKWHYDENIFFAQDFDLMFRANSESNYSNVKDILYIYRKSGVTSSYKNQLLAIYYKNRTLIKYGFKNKLWGKSSIGILVNTLRIFTAAAINAYQKLELKNYNDKYSDIKIIINNLLNYLNSIKYNWESQN